MSNAPIHAPMTQFPVLDGRVHVSGVPVDELAERVGGTPFYAYDRTVMSDRVASLRVHIPERISLHYAIKANPMPAVVQHMAGLVDGLDVASLGELHVALDTTTKPRDISFAGPGKRDPEIAAAVAAGILLNVESEGELERVTRAGERAGRRPRIAIRVNPDFELKSSGMKMSGGPKPFGIDAERVPDLLSRIAERDLEHEGFHIFSGSQNLRVDAIVEAQTATFELAARLVKTIGHPLRVLNIGGGLGIPYFPGEQRLDLEPIGQNLAVLLDRNEAWLHQTEVVMELGRFLVGEAGVYVCRIVDRKISRGQVFLVTDGGLHHHLAASGNFGQVIRKNYPVIIGNKANLEAQETASVVGPLCTPLDLLADRMRLPKAEAGDLVVVFQSGAYGRSASPLGFLSHPPPGEVLA